MHYLAGASTINLAGNQLEGTIPKFSAEVVKLDFTRNRLSGTLPDYLGSLVSLDSLFLGGNALEGTIPPSLGNYAMRIDLSNNKLRGSLPNLSPLIWFLDAPNNYLTGTISPNFGNFNVLARLNVANNQITGTLPKELGNMTSMETLDVSANKIHGSIPAELSNVLKLKTLNVSFNELSGTVPASLSNCDLQTLSMEGNYFDAFLPPSLCDVNTCTNANFCTVLIYCKSAGTSAHCSVSEAKNCVEGCQTAPRSMTQIRLCNLSSSCETCAPYTVPDDDSGSSSVIPCLLCFFLSLFLGR